MDLQKVDLNLLLAFDALMQDGNLTRAGFRLGMSQPSMSHALGRLRKLWGDPLFVRIPSGMEPTPFALQISVAVSEGLALLQGALAVEAVFDPKTCKRTFQILMSDIGELVYLPRLITKLKTAAPEVNLRILQLPRESYQDAFNSGDVDLAIGYLPALKAGFYQQRLFVDSYICIARKGHPRVKGALTLEQFTNESHILVEPAGSRYSTASQQSSTTTFIERHLSEQGLSRRVALRVPHFMVVPGIVQHTDLLATVPGSVMAHLKPMPNVQLLPPPLATPSYEIRQFWHQRSHHDLANQWLRRTMAELFST
jgi:DNA-binding transcriptional LysR family regulator